MFMYSFISYIHLSPNMILYIENHNVQSLYIASFSLIPIHTFHKLTSKKMILLIGMSNSHII